MSFTWSQLRIGNAYHNRISGRVMCVCDDTQSKYNAQSSDTTLDTIHFMSYEMNQIGAIIVLEKLRNFNFL